VCPLNIYWWEWLLLLIAILLGYELWPKKKVQPAYIVTIAVSPASGNLATVVAITGTVVDNGVGRVANSPVTVTGTPPDGSAPVVLNVTTDANGNYSASWTAVAPTGIWEWQPNASGDTCAAVPFTLGTG